MTELGSQNKSLQLEENETAESIETGLKAACNATDDLVNYYQNELL